MKNILICLTLWLGLCAGPAAYAAENSLPAEVNAAIASPDSVTLYAINPFDLRSSWETDKKESDYFDHFKIMGQMTLDKEQTAKAMQALGAAVDPKPGVANGCIFAPRHAFRIMAQGQRYDALLCYQCGDALIFKGTDGEQDRTPTFARFHILGRSDVFNQLLASQHISLAP
jgi:hypothetical protein